jgi:hypothetical protein
VNFSEYTYWELAKLYRQVGWELFARVWFVWVFLFIVLFLLLVASNYIEKKQRLKRRRK